MEAEWVTQNFEYDGHDSETKTFEQWELKVSKLRAN